MARVNAVLRRVKPRKRADQIEISGLRIDNASHRVSADGNRVDVAPKEYRLLHFLFLKINLWCFHEQLVYSQ